MFVPSPFAVQRNTVRELAADDAAECMESVAVLRDGRCLDLRRICGAASAMIPLPFSMMLYAATSMPHVDDTRNVLDLSFRNSVYERAVFCGDTLSRHFVIKVFTD